MRCAAEEHRRRGRTSLCGWKKAASGALPRSRLLWSEAQLVELNDQIQDAKAQLVSEQSQYTYYNSALNSKTNITSVEEAASRLGLMKIDQSQITYIRLDAGSVLVRKESAVHQWTDFLHDGAMTIIGAVNQAK